VYRFLWIRRTYDYIYFNACVIFSSRVKVDVGVKVGVRISLDLESGWLVVMHTYLYNNFRCHCAVPMRSSVIVAFTSGKAESNHSTLKYKDISTSALDTAFPPLAFCLVLVLSTPVAVINIQAYTETEINQLTTTAKFWAFFVFLSKKEQHKKEKLILILRFLTSSHFQWRIHNFQRGGIVPAPYSALSQMNYTRFIQQR